MAPPPALASPAPVRALPAAVLPAPERLVAIGDVHGDAHALRAALRLAGAIDERDHWSGGRLVVVQTGDLIDRGDDDREVLVTIERWSDEASRAGGALYALNGNHELMNAQGDFRYVTRSAYASFADITGGRVRAFAPRGPFARMLAGHATVLVVGDTLFVHGGLLPTHVAYGLPNINAAVRAWLLGDRPELPGLLDGEDSPEWLRRFSLEDDPATCALLGEALAAAHARRMVVGHTVQEHGINAACDERVWRIDVGLAALYHGPLEVLDIRGNDVHVLRGSAAN
jgi:hypothetical protein